MIPSNLGVLVVNLGVFKGFIEFLAESHHRFISGVSFVARGFELVEEFAVCGGDRRVLVIAGNAYAANARSVVHFRSGDDGEVRSTCRNIFIAGGHLEVKFYVAFAQSAIRSVTQSRF